MRRFERDYPQARGGCQCGAVRFNISAGPARSEEHTSDIKSPNTNSYAGFCLNKKPPVQDPT